MESTTKSSPDTPPARWRRPPRAALLAGVAAAVVALYWVLGTLVAPVMIQRAIERHDARTPGVDIEVGAVHVRPFRLRVVLDEVRVRAPAGPGAFVARRAELDWRLTALLRREPRLVRLAIDAPHARFELPACCSHGDLQQIVPGLQGLFARLAPLHLGDLEVNDARLDLDGGEGLPGRHWRLEGIHVRAHDIAPGTDARYTIGIDDAAGMRLALEGLLAREARELRGRLVAAAHDVGRFDANPPRAPAHGTFTASLAAEAPALRVEAQLQLGEAPPGESQQLVARLEYAPEHSTLRLENVPASALSARTAEALGRGLATGRIDLAITQRRVSGRFDGAVDIAADGLSLAAGANAWSLELALALLVDAHGRLALHAPLAVDAGEDLGAAIAAALQDEVARLSAEPFAVLGAVVGRPGQALQYLEFSPGSAEPTAALEAALDVFAAALEARPGLAVVIPAGFNPAHDRDALAARQVELHVSLATAEAAFRAQPEPLDFGSARVQDVLEEFAGERLAAARIASFRSRFEEEGAAYYGALFDALVATEPIADAALARLARFRARAVSNGLAARGIAPERIDIGEVSGSAAAAPDGIVLRAELVPTAGRCDDCSQR